MTRHNSIDIHTTNKPGHLAHQNSAGGIQVTCSSCGHVGHISASSLRSSTSDDAAAADVLAAAPENRRRLRCTACDAAGDAVVCIKPQTARPTSTESATPCRDCGGTISEARMATAPEGASHTRCYQCQALHEAGGHGQRRVVVETWGSREAWRRDREAWDGY